MKIFTVGDVILNPQDPGGLMCIIIAITDKWFTLTPFTTRGWPSRNRELWQKYHISYLGNMKPTTKKGGYSHLLVCPDCEKEGKTLFQAPLRKFNVYSEQYQCQRCKVKRTNGN